MKQRLQRAVGCLALCAALTGLLTLPASAAGFADVPAGHWAGGAIQRCVEEGWFQGESAAAFGVGHPMSRGAFAVVLCRFFGWETARPASAPYPDVPADAWCAGAVEAAVEHGAFTRQSGDFRPGDPITREELAAALVRGLGYGNLAGLVQDLPVPFTDVDTNRGYIAMAYELGIISGVAADTFAPDRTAPREQVAVMLTRLDDKLRGAAPGKVGVAYAREDLTDLSGYEAVAAAGTRLVYTEGKVQLTRTLDEAELAAFHAAVPSGAKELLYAAGSSNCLKGDPGETAGALADMVKEEGWDGLFLDIAQLSAFKQRQAMTDLVSALEAALGDKLLYVAAEAPAWQSGKKWEGYDYAALGRRADRLVLRVEPYSETVNGFPTAPVDPLEEVYYALGELRDQVPADKLSLWMTTTGSAWAGEKRTGAVSAAELETMLAAEDTETYYSGRYACAYLQNGAAKGGRTVVWYLDEAACRERVRLLRCFGVDQVCLSDLGSVSAGVGGALG